MAIALLRGPAEKVDGQQLANGSVRGSAMAPASVGPLTIRDEAVGTQHLQDGSVTTPKIGDDTITAEKIRDGELVLALFASSLRPIQIVANLPPLADPDYPPDAVVLNQADGKIYRNVADVWTAAVPTTDLTGQITETQITDDAITTPKIAADAVVAEHVSAGAIEAEHLAADSVTAGSIQAGAVSTSELAADAITADKIQADAVGADQLAAIAIDVTKYIKSSNYVAGQSGWAVDGAGNAEFGNVQVRGTLDGGSLVGSNILVGDVGDADVGTDFSEYASGSPPSDWTVSTEPFGPITVETAVGAEGGKRLRFDKTGGSSLYRTALWTGEGEFRDFDVVAKYRFTAPVVETVAGHQAGIFLRSDLGVTLPAAYEFLELAEDAGAVVLRFYSNGAFLGVLESTVISRAGFENGIPEDTDLYLKCRAVGRKMYAKVWVSPNTEPPGWDLADVVVDETAGYLGFGVYEEATVPDFELDTFEVSPLTSKFNVGEDGELFIGDPNPTQAPFNVSPEGALRIGASGDSLVEKRRVTVNFDAPSVAANSGGVWDIPLPAGTTSTTAKTFFTFQEGIGNTGLVPIQAQCFTVDEVRLIVRNVTGGAVNLGARDYTFDMTIIA